MMEVTDGIIMKSLISIISTDGDRKYFPSSIQISLCCCLFLNLNKTISVRCR